MMFLGGSENGGKTQQSEFHISHYFNKQDIRISEVKMIVEAQPSQDQVI